MLVQQPKLPSRKTLIRFFGRRAPVSIADASALLGFPETWVRARAAQEGVLLPDELLPWADVAYWLLEAWPSRAILARLAPYADVFLPSGLALRRVSWNVPEYLLLALERQAARDPRRHDTHVPSLERYVIEQLHLAIDDETVASLRANRFFTDAFFFPTED